jgi:hypothetical protein
MRSLGDKRKQPLPCPIPDIQIRRIEKSRFKNFLCLLVALVICASLLLTPSNLLGPAVPLRIFSVFAALSLTADAALHLK